MQSIEQFTWDQFTSVGVFLDFGSLRIYRDQGESWSLLSLSPS